MRATPFFSTPEAKQRIFAAVNGLLTSEERSKRHRLGQVLHIIAVNAEEFDKFSQINIGWIGGHFLNRLSELRFDSEDSKVDPIISIVYRIILEFDMSMKNELSDELKEFMRFVEATSSEMSGEARLQVEFARKEMPVAILKRMLNSDELGPLTNISAAATTAEQKISKWQADLEKSEEKVTRLGEILEKQAQGFNFVGLHKGFSDLDNDITNELRFAQIGMGAFGLLTLIPSSIDLWLVLGKQVDLSKIGNYSLIAALVSTITVTFLFLYFFRIALRNANSCRAQLVQVRLRMSLCRFIQSYADYSAEIKGKNGDALAKFEALIFSGIVGTEDKLPSTFDGIEQLSALAKSIRRG